MPATITQRILLLDGRSFSPLDLGASLKLWLSAARITGLVDGDPVPTWSDLSGQGNHATQGTAAKQPTYKTGIVNGTPVVRFDAVDDWLQTGVMTLAQPISISIVAYWRAVAAEAALFDGRSGALSMSVRRPGASGTDLRMNAGANGAFASGTVPTTPTVLRFLFDGAASQAWANGVSLGVVSAGTAIPSGVTLGAFATGASPGNVDIAELVLASGVIPAGTWTALDRYLGAQWGISVA